MKHQRPIYCHRLAALSVLFCHTLPLCAQDTLKVLSTTAVDLGARSIIYQRVEPPKAAATAAPAVAPATATPAAPRILTKRLSLATTVHDRRFTELRWEHAGAEYRAWSSIDFNHIRSVPQFEVDGVRYALHFGIGNEAGKSPPVPAGLAAGGAPAAFILVQAPAQPEPAALAGIAALHRYYAAHKGELIATWELNEAARIAHEAWQKAHPPVPRDTVIQFWPKKSSRHLDAVTKSAAEATGGKEAR